MALLSGCCIAGLGQIVLGQTLKGALILIGTILFGIMLAAFTVLTMGLGFVLFPLTAIIWILSAVDAYLIAKKLRRRQSVGEWECF